MNKLFVFICWVSVSILSMLGMYLAASQFPFDRRGSFGPAGNPLVGNQPVGRQPVEQPEALPTLPFFDRGTMHQFPFGEEHAMDSDDEIDSGNWYEKLRWWKEAKRVYTVDIHDAMEQLKGIAQNYDTKKTTILAKFNESIKTIPTTIQVAIPLIDTHLAELKTKRERLLESRTQDEREAIAEVEGHEKALEELKLNFEHLKTLSAQLDEAINQVYPKQAKECENYEERALEYFERIEKVLDDKKAHNYYDIVENSLENIRAIIQYLLGPLQIFIDDAAGRAEALIPKIKKAIEELEKKGIMVRTLTEKEKQEQAEAAKKREEARLKAEAEKKAREAWKNLSWWQKIWYWIGSFFSWIGERFSAFFSSIGRLFSGSGAPAKKPAPTKLPTPAQAPPVTPASSKKT